MANVTILTQIGQSIQMVCHYSTPVGNNAVGVSWANALVGAGLNTTVLSSASTSPWNISSADLASIQAGTLREVVAQFNVANLAGLTGPQKQTALTAIYNQVTAADQAALAQQLEFFGYTQ